MSGAEQLTGGISCITSAPVALITLGHGARALTPTTVVGLAEGFRRATDDPTVRVIILRSADDSAFCTGLDLGATPGADSIAAASEAFPDLLDSIRRTPKPVVGLVGGLVRGGGIGLAGVCDIVIADTGATFQFSEVLLGLAPACVLAFHQPFRVSPGRLSAAVLTAETLDADAALRLGLIDEVVDAAHRERHARVVVQALLRAEPEALAASKELLRSAGSTSAETSRVAAAANMLSAQLGSGRPAAAAAAYEATHLPRWAQQFRPTQDLWAGAAIDG